MRRFTRESYVSNRSQGHDSQTDDALDVSHPRAVGRHDRPRLRFHRVGTTTCARTGGAFGSGTRGPARRATGSHGPRDQAGTTTPLARRGAPAPSASRSRSDEAPPPAVTALPAGPSCCSDPDSRSCLFAGSSSRPSPGASIHAHASGAGPGSCPDHPSARLSRLRRVLGGLAPRVSRRTQSGALASSHSWLTHSFEWGRTLMLQWSAQRLTSATDAFGRVQCHRQSRDAKPGWI